MGNSYPLTFSNSKIRHGTKKFSTAVDLHSCKFRRFEHARSDMPYACTMHRGFEAAACHAPRIPVLKQQHAMQQPCPCSMPMQQPCSSHAHAGCCWLLLLAASCCWLLLLAASCCWLLLLLLALLLCSSRKQQPPAAATASTCQQQ